MKKFVLLFLFFPILISAQHFKLGFDTELSYVRVGSNGETFGITSDTFIPVTFNIIFSYQFNRHFSFQTKMGETLLCTTFSGFEIGFDGLYHFQKKFYGSLGLLFHSNEAMNPSMPHGDIFTKLYLISLGLGYIVSKHFTLGVSSFLPLSEKTIYYIENFDRNIPYSTNVVIKYMLRLNFVFSWDL